ncbi:DUF3768 domain-containing protein [Roseibium sp. M-1]
MSKEVLSSRVLEIRRLNDDLRRTLQGGKVMLTPGITALGEAQINKIMCAVAAFDDFNTDNDPHGEHDCALLDWEGERIMFKIDYYDLSLQYLSDDPADPKVTTRVMTILLASEY